MNYDFILYGAVICGLIKIYSIHKVRQNKKHIKSVINQYMVIDDTSVPV